MTDKSILPSPVEADVDIVATALESFAYRHDRYQGGDGTTIDLAAHWAEMFRNGELRMIRTDEWEAMASTIAAMRRVIDSTAGVAEYAQ